MPLYTADALVLRTYKLGEADRIVVFLTRDRGKKRGVAKGARRPRSRFAGALEPLTEVRVAYFEKERRELVGLELRGDGAVAAGCGVGRDGGDADALGYVELLRRAARRVGAGRRRRRAAVPARARRCSTRWRPARRSEPLARYFEYWLLRLQGVYPEARGTLSAAAMAFLAASRARGAARGRRRAGRAPRCCGSWNACIAR